MGVMPIERIVEPVPGVRPETSADAHGLRWPHLVRWPQEPHEFKVLMEAYVGALVRYALHRLGNRHDAEDVVQDVMVRVYTTRAEHRGVGQVGPYLYRMTANACNDMLRSRRRRTAWHAVLEYLGIGVPARVAAPPEVAETTEQSVLVEKLLSRLPKAQAEAVRLRVFADLSLAEIADVMACSVNTANSRLRYGFARLRRMVSEESKP